MSSTRDTPLYRVFVHKGILELKDKVGLSIYTCFHGNEQYILFPFMLKVSSIDKMVYILSSTDL